MNKVVLITGATAGIGEACAHKFGANGWDVIITGRRKERLETLEASLRSSYGVDVLSLCFDVMNLAEVQESISSLAGNWRQIAVLVNNAGLAVGTSPFQEGAYDDWERMIDTNIKGLIYLSREVSPIMISNGKGHIINIASMAGHEVYPGGNVYCATKHAVLALSKGMRMDMVGNGIKVSSVSPGATETEFSIIRYKGDKQKAIDKYKGFEPLTGADIAESVYFVAAQPEHVNIQEVYVAPRAQASPFVLNRK
ncbi:MAG: SDR family NAD(P)-dependent oxidoreductase [Bacteroidetes bacterium]|nr:SDR family NAD(P)-dependent oxidoreductase [Bacteroidota bacterium]